ncbi:MULTISPECIES: hypothetical protein [unclassified Luteibacter]|uniref:hypothetical protein n=1 Tax=Luteibacter sp. PvP019 TaxID=3156436 RepID=UPI0033930C77
MSNELWCVHIEGPDDVIAMPSRAAAETVAKKINADFADSKAKHGVTIKATAKRYTHGAESHQRNLAENYSDYAPMVEGPTA